LRRGSLRRYQGEFDRGQRHGRGLQRFRTGDVYDGIWVRDVIEGRGIMTFADGDVCVSSVFLRSVDNDRAGLKRTPGVKTEDVMCAWYLVDRYRGMWRAAKMHGRGEYIFATGEWRRRLRVAQWVWVAGLRCCRVNGGVVRVLSVV
jgi:hypothetical protein